MKRPFAHRWRGHRFIAHTVKVGARIELADLAVVLQDDQISAHNNPVRLFLAPHSVEAECVALEFHAFAGTQCSLAFRFQLRGGRDPQCEEDDSNVCGIAAVAAVVGTDQPRQCDAVILTMRANPSACALPEFLEIGAQRKPGKCKSEDAVDGPRAHQHRDDRTDYQARRRHVELLLQIVLTRTAPRQCGADTHHEQQCCTERNGHLVEEWATNTDFHPADCFRDERE